MPDAADSMLPTLDLTGLILAYVVLAALLLSLNLFSSWNWQVKTAANLVVLAFFLVTYHSWPALLGWPTERDLPRKFYLHAVLVDEPNRIYLWGADIESDLKTRVPRSYGIPYSTKLHDRVDKARRKLRRGLPIIGQMVGQQGADVELTTLEQAQAVDADIIFIDAPQGLLPPKQ